MFFFWFYQVKKKVCSISVLFLGGWGVVVIFSLLVCFFLYFFWGGGGVYTFSRFSAPEPNAQVHHCNLALSVVINLSHFRLLLLNGIQRILTGSKISMSSTKFVLIRPFEKTRWPPRPLTDCDIFDFSSETTEWNSTNLERKEDLDLNVLYQVCGFRADRKDKMATLASDWLRHFRLLLCDR